jgi:hypothetical protein
MAIHGLPTGERGYGGPQHNQEFDEGLHLLEGLPIWVVVQLCKDDDKFVEFYNHLGQLELSMEVLDNFCGRSKGNDWRESLAQLRGATS